MLSLPKLEPPTSNKTLREALSALDYIGPIFFLPAITCLFLALQRADGQRPWTSGLIVGPLCGFAVLILIWIYSQIRLGERATLPIRLLTQRTVFFASLNGFFAGGPFMIPVFCMPLYFQAIKGTTATTSALDFLPLTIALSISSIFSSFVISFIGYIPPCMIFGASLVAVGMGLLSTINPGTNFGQLVAYETIVGLGAGINGQVQPTLKFPVSFKYSCLLLLHRQL